MSSEMDSMYEILLELPLFKGASMSRISEIVGKAKFHFLKYLPNEKNYRNPRRVYPHKVYSKRKREGDGI